MLSRENVGDVCLCKTHYHNARLLWVIARQFYVVAKTF